MPTKIGIYSGLWSVASMQWPVISGWRTLELVLLVRLVSLVYLVALGMLATAH